MRCLHAPRAVPAPIARSHHPFTYREDERHTCIAIPISTPHYGMPCPKLPHKEDFQASSPNFSRPPLRLNALAASLANRALQRLPRRLVISFGKHFVEAADQKCEVLAGRCARRKVGRYIPRQASRLTCTPIVSILLSRRRRDDSSHGVPQFLLGYLAAVDSLHTYYHLRARPKASRASQSCRFRTRCSAGRSHYHSSRCLTWIPMPLPIFDWLAVVSFFYQQKLLASESQSKWKFLGVRYPHRL